MWTLAYIDATHITRERSSRYHLSAPSYINAMDILGPFPKMRTGNRIIAVITDRLSKLTQAIPTRQTAAAYVKSTLSNAWVMLFDTNDRILTDTGPLFVENSSPMPRGSPSSTKPMLTTAYHPLIIGQMEHYNKKISDGLCPYISEQQKNWDDYVQP